MRKLDEMNIKINREGFTLVEVLISVAILGMTAMIFAYLIQQQQRNQKASMKNTELTRLLDEVNRLISDKGSCTETFKGISLGAFTSGSLGPDIELPGLKSSDGVTRIANGVISSGITPHFTISPLVNIDYNGAPGNFNYGRGVITLKVELEKSDPFLGPKKIQKQFPVMVNFCEDTEVHGLNQANWSAPCDAAGGVILEFNQWVESVGAQPFWFGWCRTCPVGNIISVCE